MKPVLDSEGVILNAAGLEFEDEVARKAEFKATFRTLFRP